MEQKKQFTHLHVHSHYSLLDGLTKIDDLISATLKLGMLSVALTDHGSMYGAVEFFKKAKKAGLKPIIGSEIYVVPHSRFEKLPNERRYHLTLLVENEEGYKNLVAIVTKAHLEGFYYKPRADKELLREHAKGIIALSGCLQGEIPRALLAKDIDRVKTLTQEYIDIFGKDNFFLELAHHPHIQGREMVNNELITLAKEFGLGLVATNDTHYLKKDDAQAQDILMAVQTGARLGEGDRLTLKEGDFSLRSPEEMIETFKHVPEAISNTQKISERCNFEFVLDQVKLPHFEVPQQHTPESYLKELCEKGIEMRYKCKAHEVSQEIRNRLSYELEVIKSTGFASYFLIVQDFVNFAKKSGIVVGPGRGSAAGSLVSYLLNITNIDPLKYNLLFERFLNPSRIEMPDIDLDFADTRRDEVIEYVAQKYGKDHVAQIITFGTMAARAAIRDAGRALGISYAFCDKLAKLIPFNPTQGMKEGWLAECLKNVQELKVIYEENAEAKKIIDAALKLEGVARHASTHACGVVISKDPLTKLVPLQYAARNGAKKNGDNGENEKAIVTQYEMGSIQNLGLLKMDLLGLRNLTIIENAITIVKHTRGIAIDIENIPLNDKKVFQLLQKGQTKGIFQLEGQGMTRFLKELKPTSIEDIIAMVSLYRPGPMELLPSFIKRKQGKEPISYLHPKLEPILKNTYGIGVYQEQMMQIARDLAGYTLAEADILRKAIGKKIEKLLNEQKEKLLKGMIANGIPPHIAKEIWELFPPFARYGFNRSHAACYAMIGYQTAYLKAHYPSEFMAALMTAESSDVERTAVLIDECKSLHIEVMPPHINESFKDFTVIKTNAQPWPIRFGLGAVKNVGTNIVGAIIQSRKEQGPFKDMADFLKRVQHKDLNKKSLESLIKCGAFDSFGDRGVLLANLETLLEFARSHQKQNNGKQNNLFAGTTFENASLRLTEAKTADKKEKLMWEKELLGLYISDHPFKDYKEKIKTPITPLELLTKQMVGKVVRVGGIISQIQKVVTKTGMPMLFVELEDLTQKTEVLVFASTIQKNPSLWQPEKAVLVRGKLNERDGEIKLLCDEAMEIV